MTSLYAQQRFRNRLLRQIGRRSGQPSQNSIGARLLQTERARFLSSHAVHIVTLFHIWCKSRGEAEAKARWEVSQRLPRVPHDYRRFRGSPVEWHHKPRRTSGFRKICNFADTEKLWHVLARDLIVAQHQPRSHIGDWKGRGRDAQISEIAAAICSEHQAVVCADIRRAFASVNIDAAYDLHSLPEPLIRRAIDHRTHQFQRRERSAYAREIALAMQTDLEGSPSGLMEGSPASNAIFSVLMDDLPDHLDERIRPFVYCDNIVLLAPSLSQAQQAEIALVEYLTSHRAGPFEVASYAQSVCEPFDHLGYELQWRNGIDIGLSIRNWERLMSKIDDDDLCDAGLWLQGCFPACSERRLSIYRQLFKDERQYRARCNGLHRSEDSS